MRVCLILVGIWCSLILATDTVPGHLIVKYSSVQARSHELSIFEEFELNKVCTLPQLSSSKFNFRQTSTTVIVQTNDDVDSVIDLMCTDHRVEYVEPLYKVQISTVQNDPLYYKQSYLHSTSVPYIWGVTDTAPTLVAIVDTGVNYLHEDLVEVMYTNTAELENGIDDDGNGLIDDIRGYNFFNYYRDLDSNDPMDVHSHGTHLSGIIGATTGNDVGIAGIAQNVKLLPIRFLDSSGSGTQVDAALAIRYAADMGADVINCSWGFTRYNKVLYEAIVYAKEQGSIVVAAVGNLGEGITEYPSGFSEVIAVGSSALDGERSSFSSYGNHLDFLMYGEGIYSTELNESYGYKTGSSQSTAIVSGMIASIKSYDRSHTKDTIYSLLQLSSESPNDSSKKTGYGLINTESLIDNLSLSLIDLPVVSETETFQLENILPFPNPAIDEMNFGMESSDNNIDITIDIYDLQGRKKRSISDVIGEGYQTVAWNLEDEFGTMLRNGTYLYVVKADYGGETTYEKGKCTILK
jgi:subtilisin family serine protease